MAMTSLLTFSVIALSIISVYGFPGGAPVDVCHLESGPNRPKHGSHTAQPLSTSPYHIHASSEEYSPGKQISVTISGDAFKGFFIQARDTNTHAWIGSFTKTSNTKPYDECSAVTHKDAKDKQETTLVWNAPNDGQGQVYFTGSIVKNYSTFWVDLVSHAAH